MKKVLSLIVVLAVVLCSSVGLAETDPAVGVWYMYVDMIEYPEMSAVSEGNDSVFSAMFFLVNGDIVEVDLAVSDSIIADDVRVKGRWWKENDQYHFRLLGWGEGTFSINDNEILLNIPDSNLSVRFYRCIAFNPYKDYVR